MHIIRHNKVTLIQDTDGITGELAEHLAGLVNLMMIDIWMPLNTRDQHTTCRHCNTAHKATEARHGHCPYCWRLA
jgi:hypothetical protein